MQTNRKVLAAITGAIELYMQAEQQAGMQLSAARKEPAAPRPAFSPWVLSGRQSAMDMRQMMQARLFR